MTPLTPVFDGAGKALSLGKLLGRGGEGTVYHVVGDASLAVKLYRPEFVRKRHAKIAAMIADQLHRKSRLVAFPVDVALGRKRDFLGFVMKKVDSHRPIHELYGPKDRRKHFPAANYPFLVRAATNVARAVASVNNAQCVIGDINPMGFMVSERATVALIDADSFQFTAGRARHLCEVGVPEFTPPELQGLPLASTPRTANHDAFGLAVLIFQLLFLGRHPFAGSPKTGDGVMIPSAIGDHRFVYSCQRATGMTIPDHVATLTDMSPMIAGAFERAFGPAGAVGLRPTATQWVGLLEQFENELTTCGASPLHHHHRSARACPWCRMEQAFSTLYFLPPPGAAPAFVSSSSTSPAALWAAIEAIVEPQAAPPPESFVQLPAMSQSTEVLIGRARQTGALIGTWALGIAAVGSLFTPAAVLVFVLGPAAFFTSRYKNAVVAAAEEEAREAEKYWNTISVAWTARAGPGDFRAAKKELRGAFQALEALAAEERRRLAELETKKRQLMLDAYLDQFLIRRSRISGIGTTRAQMLASYGIETALDVSLARIIGVPGFGRSTADQLVKWRARLEQRFQFNPTAPTDARLIAQIRSEISQKRGVLESRLKTGTAHLQALALRAKAARDRADPAIASAYERLMRARTNIGK